MGLPAPLSKKLRETLGPEAGEDLVTWLQEMRAEHDELRASIRADFAQYRHEIAALIHASESRLIERIHGTENSLSERLNERLGKLEVRVVEVKSDLMKWSFLFWVGAVGAIAALAGILRH